MEKIIRITSSILPDIFPVSAYQDKKYSTNRPIRTGYTQEIFKTSEKHQTATDNWEKSRTIQAVLYNKYEFQLSAKEHNSIDLLKFADQVTLEQLDTGEVHYVNIIDISSSKLDNTQNLMFKVVYYDTNPSNYKNYEQPKNSFLERTAILDRYSTAQLIRLTIFGGAISHGSISAASSYNFYTALIPKMDTTPSSVKSTEVEGLKVQTRVNNQSGYMVKFYCKEDEMNVLKKYLPQCGKVTFTGATASKSTTYGCYLRMNGSNLGVIEMIEPEVKKVGGFVDLYECTIFAKTENISNPQYV